MRKRTSDYYSSDTEQMAAAEDAALVAGVQEDYQDIFLMRPQLRSGKMSGFTEAKRVYDNGTEEVRQLLLHECSLIYECNACRNMFRSLTQFISHKRVYCRSSAVDGDGGSAGGDKCIGFSNHHSVALEETTNDMNATTWKSEMDEAVGVEQICQDNCENENAEQVNEQIVNNAVNEDTPDQKIEEDQHNDLLTASPLCDVANDDAINLNGNHSDSTPLELAINQLSAGSEGTATRLKRFLSATCQTCEYCNKLFEQSEELSTHLLHCPVKHQTLSRSLANGINETAKAKRIKFQTSMKTKQEKLVDLADIKNVCINKNSEDIEEIEAVKDNVVPTPEPTQSTSAVLIKTEAIQNNSEQMNTNSVVKKKKLRSRQKTVSIKNVISSNVAAQDTVLTKIKQEPNSEPESVREETEKEEPKKLLSSCAFCGKSFERRAALSTHLQHCRVKNGILEKSAAGALSTPTNAKRMKLQVSAEKSSKESRLHSQLSTPVVEDSDTELLNEMFANLGGQTFGLGLRTVTLDQDDLTASTDEAKTEENVEEDKELENENKQEMEKEKEKEKEICTNSSALNESNNVNVNLMTPGAEPSHSDELDVKVSGITETGDGECEAKSPQSCRGANAEKRLLCRCKICYKQFTALSNLRRHISMFHYRAQRFGCTLCEYRAFRRYDIVNHLGNAHGMKGDPEAMSIEFVSEHEVNYTKEDVEGDIVVLTEKDVCANMDSGGVTVKTSEKRVRRNKTISVGNGGAIAKVTRQKLKRAQSQHENAGGGNGKPVQRRPIRNRIKPVNNDFVYDLSHLLKKEHTGSGELPRTLRRRSTMVGSNSTEASIICNVSLLGAPDNHNRIRGAAQRLSLTLVNQGLAASATQPELPSERPQMRQRLISTHRADMHTVPVIETGELEAARMNSTLLDDTFLEKVAKGSAAAFKIKPSLSLQNSKMSWFLEKVDSSLHNSANGKSTPNEELCRGSGNINSSVLHISPPPSIPRATEPPPTPRKRISMLDRLTENRLKYRESLLRSALEN